MLFTLGHVLGHVLEIFISHSRSFHHVEHDFCYFWQEARSDSTPSTPTKSSMSAPPIDEEPLSPASSIVSNETDAGSIKGSVQKAGSRSRGRRGRPSRASGRLTRGRIAVRMLLEVYYMCSFLLHWGQGDCSLGGSRATSAMECRTRM